MLLKTMSVIAQAESIMAYHPVKWNREMPAHMRCMYPAWRRTFRMCAASIACSFEEKELILQDILRIYGFQQESFPIN